MAIASNESFSGWTKTFTDPRLCAAIVDRLTFGGNIIETGTDSYRLATTRARAEQQAAAALSPHKRASATTGAGRLAEGRNMIYRKSFSQSPGSRSRIPSRAGSVRPRASRAMPSSSRRSTSWPRNQRMACSSSPIG